MDLLIAAGALLIGLALLALGADRLIAGAVALARRVRLSEAVIGASIVAGGTSMPELVASVSGGLSGQPGLAVGNAVGSNIVNLTFILGAIALIRPLAVEPAIARRDAPVMAAVTVLAAIALTAFPVLPRWCAAVLLAFWLAYVAWSVRSGQGEQEAQAHPSPLLSAPIALAWAAAGMALLAGGGALLVHGASALARGAGLSDTLIGLTIVAGGTSLPELVTSLLAARRGRHQLALANLIGSNTFNLLLILGATGLIAELPVPGEIRGRDLWVMLAVSVLLPLAWARHRVIGRATGGVLLTAYLVYLALLVRAAAA